MRAIIFLALLLSAQAKATTYYVAPNGSDSNAGTSLSAPFATPQAGVSAAVNPGDSVEILGGKVYGGGSGTTAPIILTHSGSGGSTAPGGACTSPITIEGYRWGPRPIIAGASNAGPGGAITTSSGTNVSCVVLNNLEISGWNGSLTWQSVSANAAATGNGWKVAAYNSCGIYLSGQVANPSHHIVISNSYIHDWTQCGIGLVYTDYVTVSNNITTNNGLYSPYQGSNISLFQSQGLDATLTTHNLVTGNWASGSINFTPNDQLATTLTTTSAAVSSGSIVIPVTSATGLNYTQVVIDPVGGCIPPGSVVYYFASTTSIALNQPTTCSIASGSAIFTGYATDGHGIIIDNNQCTQTSGCTTPYQARTLVQNNITANNGAAGLQANPVSYYVDIAGNTSYLDQAGAYVIGNSYAPGAIYVQGSIGSTVTGNIIYAGPQVPTLIGWDSLASWSNNLVFGGIIGNNGHTVPGFANVSSDPKFIAPSFDPLTSDFRLQSISPAIGAAGHLFPRSIDYYGVATPNPDSIGASQ